MPTIQRFEGIRAWQKARILNNAIFEIMRDSDLAKDYKLKDQINGSCGSIMDNISEGFGRGGNLEFIQFMEIATHLPANVKANCIVLSTENMLQPKNSMNYTT